MKPAEKKPGEVFRIIDRKSGEAQGSYSRAYCDEYDFASAESARSANCHGTFEDRKLYRIAKYRVTYTLINPDVDKGTKSPREKEEAERLQKMTPAERKAHKKMQAIIGKYMQKMIQRMSKQYADPDKVVKKTRGVDGTIQRRKFGQTREL